MIADNELLSNAHVHIFVGKFKSENFLGDIENNWVSLSKNEEVEWSIINVICDWSTESGGSLAAEYDVETCFLTRWNNLREGTALLELGILINKKSDIDVLSEVVGYDETLGGGGFDEHSLKIDLLRTSINLLELFSSKLDTAVSHLSLGLRFGFPLSLDDSILICISSLSHASKICVRWFVTIDWLFDVEEIDLVRNEELWIKIGWIHA